MMALGAGRARVVRLVLVQGLLYAAAGLAAGLPAAFVASRLLRTVVYGVTPADPATYVILAVMMAAVVVAACFVPALRATHIDPVTAIRTE
jgi:ABC-type antimicrobial peptide transport system permease subunit